MDPRERFLELLEALAADEREGTEERVPALGVVDAAIIAIGLQNQVELQEAARSKFAAQKGETIACELGCTACCENVVVVYRPEAVVIGDWLQGKDHAIARQKFLDNYPGWRSKVGDKLDEFHDLHARGDHEAAEACYLELRSRHAMCAFNDDGPCLIYDVRPNVCRFTMALDTSDYCVFDNPAGRGPKFLAFPPLDELMRRVQPVLRVSHTRMLGVRGPIAVCQAVAEILGEG
jgi:hypothetical protein